MAVKPKADPFETAPFDTAPDQNDTGGDEAQADIDSMGVIRPKENPVVVVPAPEGKVTVTLKGGVGFNAPWVVIHGKDVGDALDQINDPQITDLLERAQKASKYFADKAETPTPTQGSQGGSQTQSGQPAASVAGSGTVKTCPHGPMALKSGVSASGKAWSGWFCPTPKDTPGQCKVEWVK